MSAKAQAALAKGRTMSLSESFDLYMEIKSLGYGERFEKRQLPIAKKGLGWIKTSRSGLLTAKKIRVDLLGDGPLESVRTR